MEQDLKRLSSELNKRDETLSKQSDMLRQAEKHIVDLEKKLKKLGEERDEVKRSMEDAALSRVKVTGVHTITSKKVEAQSVNDRNPTWGLTRK